MTVTHDQITALMPDVDEIARKLAHSMPESMRKHVAEELAAAGYLAICEAAKTWRGTGPWKSYALKTARGAMLSGRRGEIGLGSKRTRGVLPKRCSQSLEETPPSEEIEDLAS